MSKIKEAFKNGKTFIPFITGGDPDLETTKKLIIEMQNAGADIIEVGIPFSDPIAEGQAIQKADLRSLEAGCTTDKLMDALIEIKDLIHIPLVFMTYINVIYKYGKKKFMDRCNQCGISGIIVPDCPYEEKNELLPECTEAGIELISMIAPTSHDRIKMIAKEAQGFLYCVSSLGVTGVRKEIKTDISGMIELVKEVSDVPCAVGFGISTPKQAEDVCKYADGAIVGSAIVRIVAEHGKDSVQYVSQYVKEMKDVVRG